MRIINIARELAKTKEIERHPLLFRGTSTEFYRHALEILQKSGQTSVSVKEVVTKIGELIVRDIEEVWKECR